ncbi:hypothetical protein HELRODRAFT_162440 [Helobdella robusta]|uniref:RRM domain-containing protein n=1 Tax=Helobdella robusta TaxID=6412 RepID=T1ESN4_HELRO|nr:hypothetical protein HELRODRAFT_162440 [Helobdella robusta]ESN98967.1 hypothetical protein HELRODRAFT_162440 [Helobdella robusta]
MLQPGAILLNAPFDQLYNNNNNSNNVVDVTPKFFSSPGNNNLGHYGVGVGINHPAFPLNVQQVQPIQQLQTPLSPVEMLKNQQLQQQHYQQQQIQPQQLFFVANSSQCAGVRLNALPQDSDDIPSNFTFLQQNIIPLQQQQQQQQLQLQRLQQQQLQQIQLHEQLKQQTAMQYQTTFTVQQTSSLSPSPSSLSYITSTQTKKAFRIKDNQLVDENLYNGESTTIDNKKPKLEINFSNVTTTTTNVAAVTAAATTASKLTTTSGQPADTNVNHPNKILLCKNLPQNVTENDVIQLCIPFGSINQIQLIKHQQQAFIEMTQLTSATNLVNFYSQRSPMIRGHVIRFNYSSQERFSMTSPGQKLANDSSKNDNVINNSNNSNNNITKLDDSTSNYSSHLSLMSARSLEVNNNVKAVLKVTIENVLYAVTVDEIKQLFSQFGQILKIVTFNNLSMFSSFHLNF